MTTTNNARELGDYLQDRRLERGYSQKRLARLSGLNSQTIIRIERGDFAQPGPDKLKALAVALDLPLADLWSLAGYAIDQDLPNPMPFLRAKYRDLSESELQALSEDVADVLQRHGIDPHGRPIGNEDEQP